MRLYRFLDKDEKKEFKIALDDYQDVKTHIKENLRYMNPDMRTLKEIPFPKGRFECSDLDQMYYIFFNGEAIVSWYDGANCDYPEDLCWTRDISTLIGEVEKLKDLEFEARNENNS